MGLGGCVLGPEGSVEDACRRYVRGAWSNGDACASERVIGSSVKACNAGVTRSATPGAPLPVPPHLSVGRQDVHRLHGCLDVDAAVLQRVVALGQGGGRGNRRGLRQGLGVAGVARRWPSAAGSWQLPCARMRLAGKTGSMLAMAADASRC